MGIARKLVDGTIKMTLGMVSLAVGRLDQAVMLEVGKLVMIIRGVGVGLRKARAVGKMGQAVMLVVGNLVITRGVGMKLAVGKARGKVGLQLVAHLKQMDMSQKLEDGTKGPAQMLLEVMLVPVNGLPKRTLQEI